MASFVRFVLSRAATVDAATHPGVLRTGRGGAVELIRDQSRRLIDGGLHDRWFWLAGLHLWETQHGLGFLGLRGVLGSDCGFLQVGLFSCLG